MRHLLALLDDGTHGTQTEPIPGSHWVPTNTQSLQHVTEAGTHGTHGTRQIEQADIAQRVEDIADAYVERLAIIAEAGDVPDSEAHRIAEAEIGRRFVAAFLSGEVAP